MSENRDGGPAFPTAMTATTNNPVGDGRTLQTHYGSQAGMTLRDYFAAQAMAGCISNYESPINRNPKMIKMMAEYCYSCADYMISAKEANP